jgi:hypothetical protein
MAVEGAAPLLRPLLDLIEDIADHPQGVVLINLEATWIKPTFTSAAKSSASLQAKASRQSGFVLPSNTRADALK